MLEIELGFDRQQTAVKTSMEPGAALIPHWLFLKSFLQVFRAQINKNCNCEVGQRLHSISKRSDFGFVVVTHPPFSTHIYIYAHTERFIYIAYAYMHQALPPPHGMGHIYWPHMRSSRSPPVVVGVWHCPTPSPPWWGCGMVCWVCMVCMVGLVWHVWKV